MWIIAVGWIYVVVLMAATEPTVVAGIMTFFGYCVLPLSILLYLTGSKRRRARGEIAARQAARQASTTNDGSPVYDPGGLMFAGSALGDDSSCGDRGDAASGASCADSSDAGSSGGCGSGD
jgi:hypothetical protein